MLVVNKSAGISSEGKQKQKLYRYQDLHLEEDLSCKNLIQ